MMSSLGLRRYHDLMLGKVTKKRADLLPEAKLCGSFPQAINLLWVACFEQGEVNDEERVGRNVSGEWRQ